MAKPNVLEQFISDSQKVEKVREIFTGLYSLDFDEFGNQAVKMAMENSERYNKYYIFISYKFNFHFFIDIDMF